MAVDAKTVAQLREMTGAGIMDAKKALDEAGGDLTKATEILRKKGIVKAAGKAERETKEGRVWSYVHANGKVGAMIEVLCETDFVARNEAFVELCKELAMHVCAADPLYVRREQVSPEIIEKEKQIYREETANQAKPENIVEKIVEGKLNKYFSETCLLEQTFIKDDTKTIEELIKEKIALLGENIQVNRFSRFNIG
ncbi:MAG: Elongation factor Ts [Candidatus Uhrbacteria bacterium GW2011_GWA2_53_10]|uniref:Elongation factor Ts n=1 Tax=Candidatus Uhrbacteria bacterium GW2011_GWA2_53_10 TaxID=1618980 RepID=A0A0G1ZX92_9BACT|nr:MAG: Elongation factor Ts [Candidatus Uhrbacteria bacterium GW2011_GWA2_53_10]